MVRGIKKYKLIIMKKLLLSIALFTCLSFKVQEEKKVTISFTAEETVLIYQSLGKLPAEQVEVLRAKIVAEYVKVFPDTTKKK